MHVEDLSLYLRMAYSRRFFDLFEGQITAQVKEIQKADLPKFERRMWSEEARQSLRYAFFLRYYASFESHLKLVCDRLAKRDSLSLRLSDINGENFLKRTNTYLTRVAKYDAIDTHRLWLDVLSYLWIRNAIIHSDGRIHDTNNIPQYVLRQTKPGAGLKVSGNGKIKLGRRFCYRAVKTMARFLLDISERKST